MSDITREMMKELLGRCIATTIESVQKQVSGQLPEELYMIVESSALRGKELTLDEVLSYVYQGGTFPIVVDIAIRGIKDGRTVIWIRPSAHTYVSDFSQTWNAPEGMGPFKNIGLMLPHPIWVRPRPLSLLDLREAGEHQ